MFYFGVLVKFLPPTDTTGEKLNIKAANNQYPRKIYYPNIELGYYENAKEKAIQYIKEVVLPTREKFVGKETPIVIGIVDFMENSIIVIVNIVPKG